jgi:hypothetical protein
MRVAVVSERTAHHAETSATTRTARLASALADRDHDVTVFCSQWWDDGEVTTTDEATGVAYRAVTHHPSAPDLRFAARLPGVVSGFDPDVIHAAHTRSFSARARPHGFPGRPSSSTGTRGTRVPVEAAEPAVSPRGGRTA